MATTTEWEWINISRAKDFTYVNSQPVFRENWSLTRRRTSTADYSSELGSSAASLTAYNGGIIETIDAPTYEAYTFDATQAWVDAGVLWISTGFTRAGVASYRCVEPAKTNTDYINVLFKGTNTISGQSSYLIAGVTDSELSSNTWSNLSSFYVTNSRPINYKNENYTTLTGDYSPTYSTSTNESRFTATTTNASFYCTGDVQSYQVGGIPWYDQTQTWQSKTPWAS